MKTNTNTAAQLTAHQTMILDALAAGATMTAPGIGESTFSLWLANRAPQDEAIRVRVGTLQTLTARGLLNSRYCLPTDGETADQIVTGLVAWVTRLTFDGIAPSYRGARLVEMVRELHADKLAASLVLRAELQAARDENAKLKATR